MSNRKIEFIIEKCIVCNGNGKVIIPNCNCNECTIITSCDNCNGKGEIKIVRSSKNK